LRAVVSGTLLFALLATIVAIGGARFQEYRGVISTYRTSDIGQLSELRSFAGSVYMTNINVPLLGHYLEYPGFGVCGPDSVSETGALDPSRCRVSFVRRQEHWRGRAPRYFVFFREGSFFPGFADCIPEGLVPGQERLGKSCVQLFEAKLRRHFPVVAENRLFSVFALE
jgi:hypothetical protein